LFFIEPYRFPFKTGGGGRIRPLCRRHHGDSGAGPPSFADAARPGPLFRHWRHSLRFESSESLL
jgi:hypothetical protein